MHIILEMGDIEQFFNKILQAKTIDDPKNVTSEGLS
jgi:hypothetical protein